MPWPQSCDVAWMLARPSGCVAIWLARVHPDIRAARSSARVVGFHGVAGERFHCIVGPVS